MNKIVVVAIGALALASVPAQAQRLRDRLGRSEMPAAPASRTIAYGADPAQRIDVWKAGGTTGAAPLVLFVHGGGWQRGSKDNATGRWKSTHYPQAGYAFASIDYRLVPAVTVEQQAQDVANALKAVLDQAATLGIDRRRVVLMGHSAGAHLVALVCTDERYLRAAGLSFADVAGVIPIDGAAYDVAAQMAEAGNFMKPVYDQAFGADAGRQRALSPTLQAAAPNAPRFLLLHVDRDDGTRQAEALAAALRAAGTDVSIERFPGRGLMGHMEINRRLGDPDYAATAKVDAWLQRVFH